MLERIGALFSPLGNKLGEGRLPLGGADLGMCAVKNNDELQALCLFKHKRWLFCSWHDWWIAELYDDDCEDE